MEDSVSENDGNTKMEFESVLNGAIGQFGRYQIINIALLALPAIFSGFMAGDYVFTAAKLKHRCAVPVCDGLDPEYHPDWISLAIPSTTTGLSDCTQYANISDSMFMLNDTCSADLFDNTSVVRCESFVYDSTNTVVYDFGLECNEWLRALAGTLNSMGAMIALPLGGLVSDYLGRRISIVIFSFNIALVGVVRAFSVNYAMYAALQFIHTAIGGGAFSAGYILATELVGAKYRVQTGATISSMFALGQVLLGVIASAVTEWRTLTLVLFTPVFVVVSYYWILTESHRWLLSKNLNDKARDTLHRAARLNGTKISDYTMDYLLTAIPSSKILVKDKTESSLLLRVFKSPTLLRRCCTTPVWWITTTFIYYGLSINSVSLSGNSYLNYIATAAIEIPGYWTAVLVLNKVGRKVTLFTGYTACAVCCIIFAFISGKNLYVFSLLVYLAGKFSIALVFTSLYLYTSELYPTRHRHSFLAFSSMMGRIGSVISPLTPPLMKYWAGIPSMLFGSMAIISALLILTQPETLGLKLPDTIEDAENIGKSKD